LIPSISRSLERDHAAVGRLFETFVVMELLRQAGWQDEPVRLFHYRDKDGREVDLILERRDGAVIGVEAKAAASVGPSDFRGLTRM
jgi:predicted AAA+ superfamily ATPase